MIDAKFVDGNINVVGKKDAGVTGNFEISVEGKLVSSKKGGDGMSFIFPGDSPWINLTLFLSIYLSIYISRSHICVHTFSIHHFVPRQKLKTQP